MSRVIEGIRHPETIENYLYRRIEKNPSYVEQVPFRMGHAENLIPLLMTMDHLPPDQFLRLAQTVLPGGEFALLRNPNPSGRGELQLRILFKDITQDAKHFYLRNGPVGIFESPTLRTSDTASVIQGAIINGFLKEPVDNYEELIRFYAEALSALTTNSVKPEHTVFQYTPPRAPMSQLHERSKGLSDLWVAFKYPIFAPLVIDRLTRYQNPLNRLNQKPVISLTKEQEKKVAEIQEEEGLTTDAQIFGEVLFDKSRERTKRKSYNDVTERVVKLWDALRKVTPDSTTFLVSHGDLLSVFRGAAEGKLNNNDLLKLMTDKNTPIYNCARMRYVEKNGKYVLDMYKTIDEQRMQREKELYENETASQEGPAITLLKNYQNIDADKEILIFDNIPTTEEIEKGYEPTIDV